MYLTREELIFWLENHEPISYEPEALESFIFDLQAKTFMMDSLPAGSQRVVALEPDENGSFQPKFMAMNEDGSYASIDDAPAGKILSDQVFKRALKRVLNDDDDAVDIVMYGNPADY